MKVINKKQVFAMTIKWIFKNWKNIGVYTHYQYDTDDLTVKRLYEEYPDKEQWHLINITENPQSDFNTRGYQY